MGRLELGFIWRNVEGGASEGGVCLLLHPPPRMRNSAALEISGEGASVAWRVQILTLCT